MDYFWAGGKDKARKVTGPFRSPISLTRPLRLQLLLLLALYANRARRTAPSRVFVPHFCELNVGRSGVGCGDGGGCPGQCWHN